jgi:hypothetical protein
MLRVFSLVVKSFRHKRFPPFSLNAFRNPQLFLFLLTPLYPPPRGAITMEALSQNFNPSQVAEIELSYKHLRKPSECPGINYSRDAYDILFYHWIRPSWISSSSSKYFCVQEPIRCLVYLRPPPDQAPVYWLTPS